MREIRAARSVLRALFTHVRSTRPNLSHVKPVPFSNRSVEAGFEKPWGSEFVCALCSFSGLSLDDDAPSSSSSSMDSLVGETAGEALEKFFVNSDDDGDHGYCSNGDDIQVDLCHDALLQDVKTVVKMLHEFSKNRVEMRDKIEHCGIRVSQELVREVISRVRNDWEAAFTFFLWAGRQPGYAHSLREYHAMISILGKMRKFDTAWAVVDEMRGVKTGGVSLVTPQTLMIMIRRYAAAHDVGQAINTFYAYKRFKLKVGIEDFHGLLSALSRYKNVQDAEQLMYCNKEIFPLNTKSYNIVLNGWSNVIGSPRQAERVWREMSKRGIRYDVVSYSSILSCYSKSGNIYKVLKMYERMKEMNIEPDRKVYNAVIHALAKARHAKEAIDLMKKMDEKGVSPNAVTYNSLIKPLCKAQKIDEARIVFDEMLQVGLPPTVQTYHAFLRYLLTAEGAFEILENMTKVGCEPTNETYMLLIRKFCRWRQLGNVFKLWDLMIEKGISPDRSTYIVLIHGLFLNGELESAHKYYAEMKEKQLLPEPNIDEVIQTWLSNKEIANLQLAKLRGNQSSKPERDISPKLGQDKNFRQQVGTPKVVRDRGFSFWE